MTDLTTFDPANLDELVAELRSQIGDVASDWWETNSDLIEGYLRALGEATIQTRLALQTGRISENAADMLMHNQELAFNQTLHYAKFTTYILAQKLLDAVFTVIAWVIYNRTGINLFPERVAPPGEGEG